MSWKDQTYTVMGRKMPGHQMRGGTFYHGSARDLPVGTVLKPGHGRNFEESDSGSVSITSDPNRAAYWATESGEGTPYVYVVEPLGNIEMWRVGLANFGKEFVVYEARVPAAEIVGVQDPLVQLAEQLVLEQHGTKADAVIQRLRNADDVRPVILDLGLATNLEERNMDPLEQLIYEQGHPGSRGIDFETEYGEDSFGNQTISIHAIVDYEIVAYAFGYVGSAESMCEQFTKSGQTQLVEWCADVETLAYFASVEVEDEYRGLGLGIKLTTEMIEELEISGSDIILLDVLPSKSMDRDRWIKKLESLGFAEVGLSTMAKTRIDEQLQDPSILMLLYHGTSKHRYDQMRENPLDTSMSETGMIYLANTIEGTEMYSSMAVENDEMNGVDEEENGWVTLTFSADKLLQSGEMGPDWDDVRSGISLGELEISDPSEMSWEESLRKYGTCSFTGHFGDAIVDVQIDEGHSMDPLEQLIYELSCNEEWGKYVNVYHAVTGTPIETVAVETEAELPQTIEFLRGKHDGDEIVIRTELEPAMQEEEPFSAYILQGSQVHEEATPSKIGQKDDIVMADLGQPPYDNSVEDIFDMIDGSYERIGGHLKIKSPDDVLNYPKASLLDIDDDPEADLFTIAKANGKVGASGTDGSKAARVAYKQVRSDMTRDDWWSEVSGKPAELMLADMDFISTQEEVEEMLGKPVEWHGEHPEGKFPGYDGWYTRKIGGKAVTKIMVKN